MKKIAKLIPIVILAALLLAAALNFVAPANVAFAASVNFVIAGENENSWKLYVETAGEREEIASSTDLFFEYGNDEHVASNFFLEKMREYLEEQDLRRTDYALAFELPGFHAQANGDTTINYSDSLDGGFSLSAPGLTSVINPNGGTSGMSAMLQYRREGEEYSEAKTHNLTNTNVGDPIFFGRQPTGKYYVRYVAVEQFFFDTAISGSDAENDEAEGNLIEYAIRRYSEEEFLCEIVPAAAPTPAITSATVMYGASAGEIEIADPTGKWTLSAQGQAEGVDADFYPGVDGSPHKIKFDYVSNDENYLPLEGIELDVYVTPAPLTVYIGDLYSKVGEPQADLQKVEYFTSALAANDEQDDLALEFYLPNEDGFDNSKPGFYIISARSANKNYNVTCVNSVGSPIIPGGRYTVYQDVYEATAPDGRKFKVYCDAWTNREITVIIENSRSLVLKGDVPEGAADFYFESVAYYTVRFVDASGNRVFPSGTFTLEWEGDVDEAEYTLLANSERDETSEMLPYVTEPRSVTLGEIPTEGASMRLDSVVFLRAVTVYPPENVWQWYNILLLAACCALATALAAVIIIAAKRRRKIWRH